MKRITAVIAFLVFALAGCKDKNNNDNPTQNPGDINNSTPVLAYGLLNKICGIWTGPVVSSTSVGNFPDYTADYRPISSAQVAAKNELDRNNDLFMSFFVVWHCNEYKLAFRNGGFFSGMKRISYLVADSVSETSTTSFYRFTDFKAGKNRSYADLLFKNDSLYMKVYTNKYNTQPQAVMHFMWDAGRQDIAASQDAVTRFSFPQKQMVKNLCSAFDGNPESIFYDSAQDVYKEEEQPYVGKTTVNVQLNSLPTSGKRVFLIITTQPLFSGFAAQMQNLKYKSRYVMMDAGSPSFTFNYMHPGSYYLYGLYDDDGNGIFSTGDYIALNGTSPNTTFTLGEIEEKTINLNLNFRVP